MDTELSPSDDASRFAALHDESLKLLDAARSLTVEMRAALEECRRRRPAVNARQDELSNDPVRSRFEKTRRGGRVSKRRRRLRRPR